MKKSNSKNQHQEKPTNTKKAIGWHNYQTHKIDFIGKDIVKLNEKAVNEFMQYMGFNLNHKGYKNV